MKRPELVVFDLDGTLIDTAPDLSYCLDQMLTQLGLSPAGEEKARGWIGNGVSMLVKRGLADDMNPKGEHPLYEEAYPLFMDIYEKNLADRGTIYPGVVEGLRMVKGEGFATACITNKHSRFTVPLMQQIDLEQYFDYIGCGNEFEKHKPHPMPLLKTAERFGVEPEECVMVGDSINDMEAARAAGYTTICVPYGYRNGLTMEELGADYVIESFTELPSLFSVG